MRSTRSLLVVLAVCAPGVASAEGTPEPDKLAVARQHFEDGRLALAQGRLDDAIKELQAAGELWVSPSVHFYLAGALQRAGRSRESAEELRTCLRLRDAPGLYRGELEEAIRALDAGEATRPIGELRAAVWYVVQTDDRALSAPVVPAPLAPKPEARNNLDAAEEARLAAESTAKRMALLLRTDAEHPARSGGGCCYYTVESNTLSRLRALNLQEQYVAAVEAVNPDGRKTFMWATDLGLPQNPTLNGAGLMPRPVKRAIGQVVGGSLLFLAGGAALGGLGFLLYEDLHCAGRDECLGFGATAPFQIFGAVLAAGVTVAGLVLGGIGAANLSKRRDVAPGRRGVIYVGSDGVVHF